jgi:hypothetical protein
MELGNLVFGNSRGEFRIPRHEEFEGPWQELCDALKLNWYGFGDEGCLIPETDGVLQNDVFAVRSYDWSDPQCDCGASAKMDAWHEANEHSPACYNTVYNAKMDAYDAENGYRELEKLAYASMDSDAATDASGPTPEASMTAFRALEEKRDAYDYEVRKQLCADHGLSFPESSMMHCDCGYQERAGAYWEEIGGHSENCRQKLPNFHYKPTNVRISWYKYPFRDAYSTPEVTPEQWRDIIRHCIDSVLTP